MDILEKIDTFLGEAKKNVKIDPGLLDWVKDYIMVRRDGNIGMAKQLKKAIDKVIKKEKLNSKDVYMYFGDPESPKNKGKDIKDFVK